jgi:hypothetical protein
MNPQAVLEQRIYIQRRRIAREALKHVIKLLIERSLEDMLTFFTKLSQTSEKLQINEVNLPDLG